MSKNRDKEEDLKEKIDRLARDEYSKLIQKKLIVVPRNGWGAKHARKDELSKITKPIRYIGLTFKTDTPYCTDQESCIPIVQEIQRRHMEQLGLPDIAFNFLISLDGTVYEGRGWDIKPDKARNVKRMEDFAIDIAYIGDWCRREVDREPYNALLKILQIGRKLNYLQRYFSYLNFYREVPDMSDNIHHATFEM